MSEWLVLTLAMVAATAVVLTIAVLSNRRLPEDDDPSETPPDVIEYMTMMIGVIYAIVLGLAIAGVWEAGGAPRRSTYARRPRPCTRSARAPPSTRRRYAPASGPTSTRT